MKETTPRGSVGEFVVLESSMDEDSPVKRRSVESKVSSGDTSSSDSRGLKMKSKPLGCC
jgi:hypothetical protein